MTDGDGEKVERTIRHRQRPTLKKKPEDNAAEGLHAAWWRENILKVSRPELAKILGINSRTIERYEASKTVPIIYRLACNTIGRIWPDQPSWSWQEIHKKSLGSY